MSKKLRSEKNCLNCGHFVAGRFCSTCGQENIETKENFTHQIQHVVEDITHFDTKFLLTIKYLFTKPGYLTLEYLKGKRVSYVHPIRLFVFTSFLFFLLFSLIPNLHHKEDNNVLTLNTLLKNAETKDDSIAITEIYNSGYNFGNRIKLSDKENTQPEDVINIQDGFFKITQTEDDSNSNNVQQLKNTFNREYSSIEVYQQEQDSLPEDKRDGYFTKKLKLTIIKNKDKSTKEFVSELVEDFMHKMHYWIFLLFPLFALILKIVYRKKNFYYSEHLILGFHLHTIILLLLLINFAMMRLFDIDITDYIFWAFFVYLFLSLKRIYNDSYIKTFFKTLLVYFMYLIFVIFFIIAIMGSIVLA